MKNVIITGGASGIGLATAKKLAKDNDMKLVIYDLYKIIESYKKYNEVLNSQVEETMIYYY